jgi:hypothetical protein
VNEPRAVRAWRSWSLAAEPTSDEAGSQDIEVPKIEVHKLVPALLPGADLYLLTLKARRLRQESLDRRLGTPLKGARPNPDAARRARQFDALEPRVPVSPASSPHVLISHVNEQRGGGATR